MEAWAILYARKSTKKAKKWLDGTLRASAAGSRCFIVVLDDTGAVLEEVRCRCTARELSLHPRRTYGDRHLAHRLEQPSERRASCRITRRLTRCLTRRLTRRLAAARVV